MICSAKNPATRRYFRRFIPAMTLYVLFLFAVVWVFARYHPGGATAIALAALPAMPLVGVLVIVGLYLADEQDEFQRDLLVQSLVWSIGATLAMTTVWGFLEMFLNVRHLQPFLLFPLFWMFVGISSALLKLRYR